MELWFARVPQHASLIDPLDLHGEISVGDGITADVCIVQSQLLEHRTARTSVDRTSDANGWWSAGRDFFGTADQYVRYYLEGSERCASRSGAFCRRIASRVEPPVVVAVRLGERQPALEREGGPRSEGAGGEPQAGAAPDDWPTPRKQRSSDVGPQPSPMFDCYLRRRFKIYRFTGQSSRLPD